MKIKDIKNIISSNVGPSVSIYVPTSRNMSDKLQDPIRVKNTIEKAIKEFSVKYPKESSELLVAKLNQLYNTVDFTKTLNGLVFFVNSEISELFPVEFDIPDEIIVGDRFSVLPLLEPFNYSVDYWLLSLNEKPTRLFLGRGHNLSEVTMDGFPYQWLYEVTNDSVNMAVESGDAGASYQTAMREYFMRDVDKLLAKKLAEKNLPVILVGTDRNIGEFKKVTKHAKSIIGEKYDDFSNTPTHEIIKKMESTINNIVDGQHDNIASELETARNHKKYEQGLTKLLDAVKEGRIHALYLASDLDLTNPKISELINKTIETDGIISFVNPKVLKEKENIAAVLRW